MKIFNVKILAAFLLLGMMVFTACDETTTTPADDAPVITSVTPGYGMPGDTVTINGTDFGDATDPGTVSFILGTTEYKVQGAVGSSDYLKWTATQIQVRIPAGVPKGKAKIKVFNGSTELNSNQVDFIVGIPPTGPSEAMATSKSNTAVIVKWKLSADAAVSFYRVYVYQGSGAKGAYPTTDKTTDRLTITGLTEGTEFTFVVKAVNAEGMESAEDVSVKWAPAWRFYEDQYIKMYEYSSEFGSGIELYDETTKGPLNRSVSDLSKVNIAIDTRNNSLKLQCGSLIGFGTGTPPVTEMSEDYWDGAASLDNVFDSQSLAYTGSKWNPRSIDLVESSFQGEGVVFAYRTKEPGQTDWNYAKVLIKKTGGKFLQGDSPNRYVECVISYQKIVGVPYAR